MFKDCIVYGVSIDLVIVNLYSKLKVFNQFEKAEI